MTREPWTHEGYSDITGVEIADSRLFVHFANGDVVEVPALLTGELEGANAAYDPDEALEVILRDPEGRDRYLSWTQIRSVTDPAFAQHLRDLDAEEARRL